MRYKCTVSYAGTNYNGWQRQAKRTSIQEEIEKVLKHITRQDIRIHAAGRTDAKVNAIGQVFHFDTELEMTPYKWKGAMNGFLPKDIHIVKVEEVDHLFHARYCAKTKRYDYRINLGEYDVFNKDYCYQCPYKLDVDLMIEASKIFIGRHDFSSFCANTYEEMPDQVRTILSIDFKMEKDVLVISYYGKGFMRYMVRMMTASLIEVGRGMATIESVQQMLDAKSKGINRKNAKPEGLTLVEIEYMELIVETKDIIIREPFEEDVMKFHFDPNDLERRIVQHELPRVYSVMKRNNSVFYGYCVLKIENDKPVFEFLLEDLNDIELMKTSNDQLVEYVQKMKLGNDVEIRYIENATISTYKL